MDTGTGGKIQDASDIIAQNDYVQKALSDIIVEYAALLANNKDESATVAPTGYGNGALYYDESNHRLIGDFNPALWRIISGPKSGQQADRAKRASTSHATFIFLS
ncbi:MAG: hypothetical protein P8Z80_20790 [Pseudolabrys sp.]